MRSRRLLFALASTSRNSFLKNSSHSSFAMQGLASKYFSTEDETKYRLPRVKVTQTKGTEKLFEPKTVDKEEEEIRDDKRIMMSHYDKGNFSGALEMALIIKEKVLQKYGEMSTFYASSLSDIALMHKWLNEHNEAMENYVQALKIYYTIQGKETANNARILANLGILYQTIAVKAKKMDQASLFERAKEAFHDSLSIREKVLGQSHKETVMSRVLVAGLYAAENQMTQSIQMLMTCLADSERLFGKEDLLTATILNNLGLRHKTMGAFDEAKKFYADCLNIRSKVLGDEHPETIYCQHNLSECLLAMGKEDEALSIKNEMMAAASKNPVLKNLIPDSETEEQSTPQATKKEHKCDDNDCGHDHKEMEKPKKEEKPSATPQSTVSQTSRKNNAPDSIAPPKAPPTPPKTFAEPPPHFKPASRKKKSV